MELTSQAWTYRAEEAAEESLWTKAAVYAQLAMAQALVDMTQELAELTHQLRTGG